MLRYILKRLLACIPVLLAVSVFAFLIVHLIPGDPLDALFQDVGASPEKLEQIRENLGLNDPLPVQYWHFLSRAVRGDLGRSISSNRPVSDMLFEQLPATIRLAVTAMALAVMIGIPIGLLAALRQNSILDTLTMAFALLGLSFPTFFTGLVLILVFSLKLGWLPATGIGTWRHVILPAGVLGFGQGALIARVTRSSMIEVMGREYITTARAKGLRERRVVVVHALRNAIIPTLTVTGLGIGSLLNGAVVVEAVFARQGIGTVAIYGILQKDYPVVQAVVLLSAVIYTVVNLVFDVLYALFDPRIRYE